MVKMAADTPNRNQRAQRLLLLGAIAGDLASLLGSGRCGLLRLSDEPSPFELDLIFRSLKSDPLTTLPEPEMAEPLVPPTRSSAAPEAKPATTLESALASEATAPSAHASVLANTHATLATPPPPRVERSHHPENALCDRCAERISFVRNYRRRGEIPLLVLHYNGAIDPKNPLVSDRSNDSIFASHEADDLFARLLHAAGTRLEALHYQEFPACYFNIERTLAGEWQQRLANCRHFLDKSLREGRIRALLITSGAAPLIYGGQSASGLARSGEPAPFLVNGVSIPARVIRSPRSILALESRRQRAEQLLQSGAGMRSSAGETLPLVEQEQRIAAWRREESAIKKQMLKATKELLELATRPS